MKKFFVLFLVCFGLGMAAEAQQITRFAVVDMPRVHMAFFHESRAVRELEERGARVQAEIDRMTTEIQTLRVNMVNAQAQGNQEQALRLEGEISRRTNFLIEFHRTRTAELEAQKARLARDDSYLGQIQDQIRFIAESEGFSMVLNLHANNGIVWFSPTVDITDRLITNLLQSARR